MRPSFPSSTLEKLDEAETKTMCPACKGCGKSKLTPTGPSTYRWVICDFCQGEGMVPASRVSGVRKKAPV